MFMILNKYLNVYSQIIFFAPIKQKKIDFSLDTFLNL